MKKIETPKTDPVVAEVKKFQEKPNAINVIKSCGESLNPPKKTQRKNAISVINGPFKLAFKTDTFKHNYNIHNRDYVDPTTNESLNICQRILSPMDTLKLKDNKEVVKSLNATPKNVITSVGKVNEKDSLEICKRILYPVDPSSLHYETSFENNEHAMIKNMKFKIDLSTYTKNQERDSHNESLTLNNYAKKIDNVKCDVGRNVQYTELQPVRISESSEHQSVIVNLHSEHLEKHSVRPFNEMHWRKRTSQISNRHS